MKVSLVFIAGISMVTMAGLLGSFAHAALTAPSELTQTINGGVISTDIRSATNTVVAAPSFAMSAVTTSTTAQGSATGTFGTSTQRISVDNPGGANNGWTLAVNATLPGTGAWTSGSNNYAYNGTAATGQLTVNPTLSTITAVQGDATGITKGTSGAFSGSTPITIMSAGGTAAKVWNGYMTGVALTQTIPIAQATGSYTLNMTQTVAAI